MSSHTLKWRHAAPALALATLLAACATPTPYQPLGPEGGYTTQQIENNRFRVRFVGNSLTSRERVENYLLFRAAELTANQGFNCFTTVTRDVDRNVRTQVTPGFGPYRGWSPYWRFHGAFGWRTFDPWLGDPFLSDFDIRTIDNFEAEAEIVMNRGPCADAPGTFNASQVIANLGPTIQLPMGRV